MKTHRYAIVDRSDTKVDDIGSLEEAKRIARAAGDCAVVMETYEYSDSEVVWTPDGSDVWPPKTTFTVRDSVTGEWPAEACTEVNRARNIEEALVAALDKVGERITKAAKTVAAGAKTRLTVTDDGDPENSLTATV